MRAVICQRRVIFSETVVCRRRPKKKAKLIIEDAAVPTLVNAQINRVELCAIPGAFAVPLFLFRLQGS